MGKTHIYKAIRDALWLTDIKCPPVGDIPQEVFDELNKIVVIRTLDM